MNESSSNFFMSGALIFLSIATFLRGRRKNDPSFTILAMIMGVGALVAGSVGIRNLSAPPYKVDAWDSGFDIVMLLWSIFHLLREFWLRLKQRNR